MKYFTTPRGCGKPGQGPRGNRSIPLSNTYLPKKNREANRMEEWQKGADILKMTNAKQKNAAIIKLAKTNDMNPKLKPHMLRIHNDNGPKTAEFDNPGNPSYRATRVRVNMYIPRRTVTPIVYTVPVTSFSRRSDRMAWNQGRRCL